MDTRPRTSLISFCTVQLRTLCAAHSLATLCLFMTSGPDPGEFPGFWGSMVFRHAPIPRKGSGKQQQQQQHLLNELEHLKTIHVANLGQKTLSPFDLLNRLHTLKIDTLFPNVLIMLRIFCTLPVTVAQAERSFSPWARVENVLRSTMCQERPTSLGMLAVEGRLARTIDYNSIIELLASRKAQKVLL